MEWLIVGAVLGVAGWRLSSWAHAKNISIRWYVWLLIVIAAMMAAITAMDYSNLRAGMEPAAAGVILWLFRGPAVILALIAVGLVWWQNRETIRASGRS